MDHATWLSERRKGIGSSDAAAACGLRTFGRGPLDVYLDKLGLLPPVEETEQMALGHELEPVVARLYERRTGRKLVDPGGVIFSRDGHPWQLATPDRFDDAHTRVVELKTAWSREGWGPPDTDEVPEAYLVQVQHQLAVLDLPLAEVAALVCGEFRVYTVPRNEELIERITDIEGQLWRRIVDRVPPEPDWEDHGTPRLLDLLHRPEPGVETTLPEESLAWADTYEQAGIEIARLERARSEARAHLGALCGSAALALLPDGRRIRRTEVAPTQVAYTRRGYTHFTLTAPKGARTKETIQ